MAHPMEQFIILHREFSLAQVDNVIICYIIGSQPQLPLRSHVTVTSCNG
jgi:hypothetical protein